MLIALLLLAGGAFGRTLTVSGVEPGNAAAVLLIRAAGRGCSQTVVRPLPPDGVLKLDRLVSPACWPCSDTNAGLAVQAQGHAAEYVRAVCGRKDIDVRMKARKPFPIHVWPASEAHIARALDDIANTDWVLDRNMAGITLRATIHWPNAGIAGVDCNKPPKPEIQAAGGLNVYYAGGTSNQACEATPPYVVVHDTPVLGDLAHELGHALGLKHSDHQAEYDVGHTTEMPGFDCANGMWEGTEVLTDHYSLGQAFWVHWVSTSSFAEATGVGLPCATDKGRKSPCPPLRLAQIGKRPKCVPCKLSVGDARKVCDENAFEPYESGSMRLCSAAELKSALTIRYRYLSEHLVRNPELRMGSEDLQAFLGNWRKHLGLTLAIEATARSKGAEREQGLQYLREELNKSPESAYLAYAVKRIQEGVFRPRCAEGRKR